MKQLDSEKLKQATESLPSRERGLKRLNRDLNNPGHVVAPFTGAWIETPTEAEEPAQEMSLPSRERGLKQIKRAIWEANNRSLPSRERGLKQI